MPSAARSTTSFWIWALAPTSMPRVGSSRISSRGSVISQRASRHFCWLPPERLRMSASGFAGRMSSALIHLSTSSSAVRRGSRRAQPRRACSASTMLSRTVRSPMRPSPLRSSEEKAMRSAMAASGLRSFTGRPSISTVPESARSAPNSSRASSVRPDPSSPASPIDLARCAPCRSAGAIAPVRPRPAAARKGRRRRGRRRRLPASRSRSSRTASSWPTILRHHLQPRRATAISYSPTSRPLRRIVVRSEIS